MNQRNTRRGFTLIELLVVVLIIGILAAVAMPQYTKAVEKSRLVEALQNINAIQKCFDLFKLENGLPSSGTVYLENMNCAIEASLGELQIANPRTGATAGAYYNDFYGYNASCSQDGCYIDVFKQKPPFYTLVVFNGEKECYTQETDPGRYICKSIENQGWAYVNEEY